MPRENAHDKARRLVSEGRVVVTLVQGHHVTATVRGDTEFHAVFHRSGRWSCSCPASGSGSRPCSHIQATQLVTAPAGQWVASPDHIVQVGGRPVSNKTSEPAVDPGSVSAV